MLVFLIVVSLILNIISLLAIVILFLRQNKLLQVEANQKKTIKEMEELIHSYILEIKDENEAFIKKVKKIQNEKQDYRAESSFQVPVEIPPIPVNKPADGQNNEGKKVEETKELFDLSSKLEKTVSLQAVKAYQQYTPKKQEASIPAQSIENKDEKQPLENKKENQSIEIKEQKQSIQNTDEIQSIIETKQAFLQAEKSKTKKTEALIQDSLLTQVMIMQKEGVSAKEMARKLKRGKTEIELLLKFYENK